MQLSKYHLKATHQCSLIKSSNSCLPILPPQSNRIRKWIREFRNWIMVSSNNNISKLYFRSRASMVSERKRHLRSRHSYIIHPFSDFSNKVEIIMCVLWFFVFFKDPFVTAFVDKETYSVYNTRWTIAEFSVNFICMIYILLRFFTGIHNIQTKEVILEPSKIAKRYLFTYFIFDIIGTIPFDYIYDDLSPETSLSEAHRTALASLHFLRFARIKTAMRYFRRITEIFHIEDSNHHLICLVLLSLYLLHWCTCLIYVIPIYEYAYRGGRLSNKSWVMMAHIQPNDPEISITRKYMQCLITTYCHFYRAGIGMFVTEQPYEQVMFSLLMIIGMFFTSYILVVVLQMVSSASSSQSKYEEIVNQLGEYMRKNKLPLHVRHRLVLYYENRFQKHYFKEQAILNTLSEHLRYEIFLHSCKGLVEKVSLFQELSKSTVGAIVGCLRHEVFLPNDVIVKEGTMTDGIYFISYGTAACILPSGKEFCHFEDGDHFGEAPFFIRHARQRAMYNVIALEITEVFKLDKRDLEHCMYNDEDIGERLEKIAYDRLAQMQKFDTQEIYSEGKHRRDVLYELRQGRILEHTRGTRR